MAGHSPAPQPCWWCLGESEVRKGKDAGKKGGMRKKSVRKSPAKMEVEGREGLQVPGQRLPCRLRSSMGCSWAVAWMFLEGTSVLLHSSRWGKELAMKGSVGSCKKGWGEGMLISVCILLLSPLTGSKSTFL